MTKETCAHCGFDDAEDQQFTVYDDDGRWEDVISGKIAWFQRICPFPPAVRYTYRACYEARPEILRRLVAEFPGKIVVG